MGYAAKARNKRASRRARGASMIEALERRTLLNGLWGSVQGFVYNDVDKDGAHDAWEPGVGPRPGPGGASAPIPTPTPSPAARSGAAGTFLTFRP